MRCWVLGRVGRAIEWVDVESRVVCDDAGGICLLCRAAQSHGKDRKRWWWLGVEETQEKTSGGARDE